MTLPAEPSMKGKVDSTSINRCPESSPFSGKPCLMLGAHKNHWDGKRTRWYASMEE